MQVTRDTNDEHTERTAKANFRAAELLKITKETHKPWRILLEVIPTFSGK